MTQAKTAEERFWDRYLELLRRAAIPDRAHRWYVLRVEQYIRAHPELPLRRHQAAQVAEYLAHVGRDPQLLGWQFRQVAHGLQLLFEQLLCLEWAASFDWQYWLDSGQELQVAHPTVARHNSPLSPPARTDSATQQTSPTNFQLSQEVTAELRRRNYSIRTEQAYLAWLQRYLDFHDSRPATEMGAREVATYSSHLAVARACV
jgi:hypothetical protein